jgi:putative ABC transport system substrate-binding protein
MNLKRRDFITLLGGAVAAWPVAARAQQGRVRRIAVLLPATPDDLEIQARLGAFQQGLAQLDWIIGRNVRVEPRWATANTDAIRRNAAELVAQSPDIFLANGASTVGPLLQETRTIPIVFVAVTDPVGAGLVANLAHPGGNATGFLANEFGISAKWLELLKRVAPLTTRAALLGDPTNPSRIGQFAAIQTAAPLLGMEASLIDVREASEIERQIATFARAPNGGLIILSGGAVLAHRDLIIALAASHKLPAVYPFRYHVVAGGLISYGEDSIDPFRRAAGYVDRILKGEKPADLPVQAPTKYETVINLKTAKALGLTVPPTLLALADEVIE